jgi:hypothetical protein
MTAGVWVVKMVSANRDVPVKFTPVMLELPRVILLETGLKV